MIVSKNTTLYAIYFAIVATSFIYGTDILPGIAQLAINRFLYILILAFFLLSADVAKGLKKSDINIAILLACFSVSYLAKSIYYLNEISFGFFIANGLVYPAIFGLLIIATRKFPIDKLISPFLAGSSILIFASLAVSLGLKLTYYNPVEGVADAYAEARESAGIIAFSGVYLNQNSLAALTLVAAMIAWIAKIINHSNFLIKNNLIFYGYMSLLIVFLLLTLSRAPILAAAIFFFLFYLKFAKNKTSLLVVFFLAIAFISVDTFLQDYVNQLFWRIDNDADSGRIEIWRDAIAQFKENYLFGVGIYQFRLGQFAMTAHNIYLQMLASHGALVFFFWISFIIYYLGAAIKIYIFSSSKLKSLQIISAACLVAILVHQLFETHIDSFSNPLTLLMFFSMAQIHLLKKNRNQLY